MTSAIGTALSLLIGAAFVVHLGIADAGLLAAEEAAASAHRLAAGDAGDS